MIRADVNHEGIIAEENVMVLQYNTYMESGEGNQGKFIQRIKNLGQRFSREHRKKQEQQKEHDAVKQRCLDTVKLFVQAEVQAPKAIYKTGGKTENIIVLPNLQDQAIIRVTSERDHPLNQGHIDLRYAHSWFVIGKEKDHLYIFSIHNAPGTYIDLEESKEQEQGYLRMKPTSIVFETCNPKSMETSVEDFLTSVIPDRYVRSLSGIPTRVDIMHGGTPEKKPNEVPERPMPVPSLLPETQLVTS